jgi:hypothetical protein
MPHEAPQSAQRQQTVVFIHSTLDDYGLSPAQFRVFCHISRRAGKGFAYPAVESMARICQLHPHTIRKSLKALVKYRLLHCTPRPGKTSLYRVNPPALWQPSGRPKENRAENDTPPLQHEGGPTQMNDGEPSENQGAEGFPLKGNPKKENQNTHISESCQVPSTMEEALIVARKLDIEEEFARQEFHAKKSVGWKDGYGNPITSWPDHLLARWSIERRKRAERRGPGSSSGKRPQPTRQFEKSDYQKGVSDF